MSLRMYPCEPKQKWNWEGFSSIEKFHSLEIIRVDNALFAPLVRETTFLRKPLRLWVVDGTVIVPASDVLIETTTFIKGKLHHWKFRTGANIFCYDHRYQWDFFFNLCNNTRTCFFSLPQKVTTLLAKKCLLFVDSFYSFDFENFVNTKEDFLGTKNTPSFWCFNCIICISS